jgi:hypothetical protein
MVSWLRCVDGKVSVGRILVAVTLLGVSWNAALPARADDGPAKRNPAPASAAEHAAGDNTSSETMYTVTYEVAGILSQIQDERHLDAEAAKEFLQNRVKGPPVMQLEFDTARPSRVRIEEPQWLELEERLVVVANQAGHEQVSAMLAAFRKFGVVEYAISVRFVTMTEAHTLVAFPDSTSSLLTTNQNEASRSEAAPLVSEIPPVYDGTTAVRARTIIEEDSTMRFRVLDNDALTKLLKLVDSNRLSNCLESPPVTTFNGQTASLSDLARSKFVVGANLLSSGGHELKTKEVAEGTSLLFRPAAEPNGDIRLDFAASFTKIENVTKEILKIAPDQEIALQIPKVATCQVDGGVVLKPGQSLMFGGVKRLSEGRSESLMDKLLGRRPKREVQELVLILRAEPYELPRYDTARVSSVADTTLRGSRSKENCVR